MGKSAFILAALGAVGWFARELWPYVKTWLDDRKISQRTEQLRIERERQERE